ncbi:MAG: hypothetical protein QOI83_3022 [Streptomycetaceae bacterium]|nr:hypothetical protein [Streptomycetaceae bacterium]
MREEDLTPTERQIRDAFARGEEVDLRAGDPEVDDPANSADWGPARTVRAAVLALLLLGGGPGAPVPGRVPALRLTGVRVYGGLDLDYSEIPYRLTFKGCYFADPISLYGARTRQLSVKQCHLVRLNAANASIDGNARFNDSRFTGLLRLDAAHITGVLQLDGARLFGATHSPALAANRLRVEDHIWLRDGFTAEGGEVVLRGAQVGGDLDMTGARLSNPGGTALAGSRMRVEGDIIGNGMRTEGELRLPGATVAGGVRLWGARLSNPGGTALRAYGLEVAGSLHLTGGFEAEGRTALTAVRVGGELNLRDARLTAGPGRTVLRLWQTQARETDLRTTDAPEGCVDLRHASLGVIRDDPETWPADLRLDGLRYDRFENPLPAPERLRWLTHDRSGYAPQPFEQLALAYRTLGHENEARTVLLAKERARHRILPWYARLWGAVQDATVGYGYRPTRAPLWLLGLLAAGSVVFSLHHPVRNDPAGPETFNPVVFTLDHLLPVVSFGQGSAFTPTPGTQWVGYVLTAAGWILATTIATGITRSVNRA